MGYTARFEGLLLLKILDTSYTQQEADITLEHYHPDSSADNLRRVHAFTKLFIREKAQKQ